MEADAPTGALALVEDERWRLDAACRPDAIPRSRFFPERGRTTAAAVAICRGCPVREECLAYALRHRIEEGVWGGLRAEERRELQPDPEPYTRRCARCGERFETTSGARRYCSPPCRRAAWRASRP